MTAERCFRQVRALAKGRRERGDCVTAVTGDSDACVDADSAVAAVSSASTAC